MFSNEEALVRRPPTMNTSLRKRSFPVCPKCNQKCFKDENGSFVRAFNQVYHYNCFVCEDCSIPVADNYYPISSSSSNKKQVLCEFHHLKRLGLICLKCNKPTTSTTNYHPECIQCPSCVTPTLKHHQQYEYKGTTYCRLHYSLIKETQCIGCNQAILKQFVEHTDLPDKIWHPECYMIYKFWSVKLAPNSELEINELNVLNIQIRMDEMVTRVWTDLSSFEESSANCISDMLLNVAAGAYVEGIRMANQFIMHLQVLFNALDLLQKQYQFNANKEAISICRQLTRFFELLSTKSVPSTTQELLKLVTGLAQNLKSLIRIGLTSALYMERELDIQNTISNFLDQLLELEKKRVWIAGRYWFKDQPENSIETKDEQSNTCYSCQSNIEETDCYQLENQQKWHPLCFSCSECKRRLIETSVRFVSDSPSSIALFCKSCCGTKEYINNNAAMSCHHVSLLQQILYNLKLYLSKVSFFKQQTDKEEYLLPNTDKLTNNNIILSETKRQKSILRMLNNRFSNNNSNNGNNNNRGLESRKSSVRLGQMEQRKLTSIKRKPRKDELVILTSTTAINSESPASAVSPSSTILTTPTRLVQTIRRTFSTSSSKSRKSIYDAFNKRSTQNGRRASMLDIDEKGQPFNKPTQLSTVTRSQDFVLRHATVIYLQPLIKPEVTLDQLINFIQNNNSKNKRRQKKTNNNDEHHNSPSALWGKLITHIKSSSSSHTSSSSVNKQTKVFGVSLNTLIEREQKKTQGNPKQAGVTLRDFTPTLAASYSDNALVPTFLKTCILALFQADLSTEGIFRKNGNIRQLKALSEAIDQLRDMSEMEQILCRENSIQLAALLKKFLRELPEPLMTFSLYPLFIRCNRTETVSYEEKKRILHLAFCLLPKPNRDTTILLFYCLKQVAAFSETSKMDIPNLARVIAPSIFFDGNSIDPSTAKTDRVRLGAQEEISMIELLIREIDEIAFLPSEVILLSLGDANQDMSDLDSKYFISHYSQLLAEINQKKTENSNQNKNMSKSANNSPTSPINKLTQSTLLSRHHFGLPRPFTVSNSTSTPIPPVPSSSAKQRKSWIPHGLRAN